MLKATRRAIVLAILIGAAAGAVGRAQQLPAPTRTKSVAPVYPDAAQAAGIEGDVLVQATIGPDGKVTAATVVKSIPALDQAALDAVRQWEYTPTLVNGVGVPVRVTVTVHFAIEHTAPDAPANDTTDPVKRGNDLSDRGRFSEAIAAYTTALMVNPNDSGIYYRRSVAYRMIGETAKALADATQAIALMPSDATLYINRATTYRRLQRYDEALRDDNRAIELSPRLASAFNDRAASHQLLGHLDEALADTTRAIELDPKLGAAYQSRADIYLQKRLFDKALADANQALSLDPRDTVALLDRARIYEALGRFDAGLGDANEAVRLNDPRGTLAYSVRASLYADLHRYREAATDFSIVLGTTPNDVAARLRRATLFFLLQQNREAEADLDQARSLGASAAAIQSARDAAKVRPR